MKKPITNPKDYVGGLEPFSEETYKNMDLDRLAVYTMALLLENNIPLYFDYIVVALFRLFPEKFSLVNFREYPDADRVEKVLLHLKPRDRNWAVGNVKEGYSLTEIGKEVAKQAKELLSHPLRQKIPISAPQIRTRAPEVDIEEIQQSELYKKWIENNKPGVGEYDIWSFFHAVPYTPKNLLRKYLIRLKQSAELVKDKKVLQFLQWLEKEYSYLLKEESE